MMMRWLFLQLFAIITIQAQENPIPSVLLKPRNFNPHPYKEEAKRYVLALPDGEDAGLERKFYQQLVERFRNTGPVKFPNDPNIYQLPQQQLQRNNAVAHIIDKQVLINSPYNQLQVARRPPIQTRYTNTADQRQILLALANHAKRVQNNEFQNNVHSPTYTNRIDDDDDQSDDYQTLASDFEKKQYNFAYAVKDSYSGDDFSHSQKQENGKVQGSYKVRLPDNRIQITKYVADEKGYRAEVIYEDDGSSDFESSSQAIPQIQHEQKHLISMQTFRPNEPNVHSKIFYPQQSVNQLKHRPRFTVTPTPYAAEFSHIQAPIRKSYPSTTALPSSYF